jgi:hypothetical protein
MESYHGVARLWDAWSREGTSTAPQAAELHQQRQRLRRHFDAWCMLLVVRGCTQLGMVPTEIGSAVPIRPGCVIGLSDGYQLEWESSGTIQIRDEDNLRVRLVPLPHAIDQTADAMSFKGVWLPSSNPRRRIQYGPSFFTWHHRETAVMSKSPGSTTRRHRTSTAPSISLAFPRFLWIASSVSHEQYVGQPWFLGCWRIHPAYQHRRVG